VTRTTEPFAPIPQFVLS